MQPLSPDTISKLYYLDMRIKGIYHKNGHESIPIDGCLVQEMIDEARNEIAQLFRKIWGEFMGYHLLGKFYECQGNIFDFYMALDLENKNLFTDKDW